MEIIAKSDQVVHVMAKMSNTSSPWIFSVYTSPQFEPRKTLWHNMKSLSMSHDNP